MTTKRSSVSRREFLSTATAGASAASSLQLSAAGAETALPTVLPPAGRIDCQSHLFCPQVVALMEERTSDPRVFTRDGVRVVQMGDWLRKIPPHYKSIWLDVVSPLPLAIKFGHAFMGPDRLLFSSDHPWVEPGLIIDCVTGAGLSVGDQEKIFSGNARKLFQL